VKKYISEMTGDYIKREIDGLIYFYLNKEDKISMLQNYDQLNCQKVSISPEQKLMLSEFSRQIIIQLNLSCGDILKDNLYPHQWCVPIDFFLPSGCYATMAVDQFIHSF